MDELEKKEYELKINFSVLKAKKYIRFNLDEFVRGGIDEELEPLFDKLKKHFKQQDKQLHAAEFTLKNEKGGVLVNKKYLNTGSTNLT